MALQATISLYCCTTACRDGDSGDVPPGRESELDSFDTFKRQLDQLFDIAMGIADKALV
jgi:hypothetical protein